MLQIASEHKIAYHKMKIESYLRNEPIFPATLELDITSECTRRCPDCPSSRSAASKQLSMEFLKRLFACLEGQTEGLLLTGGEPTMSPTFPKVLSMARKSGFLDVAVVTNGSLLSNEPVAAALLTHASTIRVSMYDWSTESCEGLEQTLKKIEGLRTQIDKEGSKLQIGVSILTSKDKTDALGKVADAAGSAGAHWIYFHPMCTGWESGSPAHIDQEGVMTRIKEYQNIQSNGFQIHVLGHRYRKNNVYFNGYHAAHFLLVIGADGINYLGAEVKYQPQHAISNVADNWRNNFLWQNERLELIKSVKSRTYRAVRSRHRGVLYSGLIERLKSRQKKLADKTLAVSKETFRFPHIL